MAPEAHNDPFFRVEDMPTKDMMAGIRLRSVHLENLMMTFVDYLGGSAVPTHFHPAEQITYVLEGLLEITVGSEHQVLGPGEGVCIPPNAEHSSHPVDGAAKALDAWTPVVEHFKVESATTLGRRVPIAGESPY